MRAKSIKFLKESIGIILHDLGLHKEFLNMTPKAQVTQEKYKLGIIKLKLNFNLNQN